MLEFMPKDEKTAVDELFPGFQEEFYKILAHALESGHVSREEMMDTPYYVHRAVLHIAAERYVWSKIVEKRVKELRHFI